MSSIVKKIAPSLILVLAILVAVPTALAERPAVPSYVYGPHIDRLTFPVMRVYTMRILAFEANEIDMVGVLPIHLDRIRANRPDAHIFFTVGINSLGALHFNVELWPVKYPELRKAIAHLWDRDRIIADSPLRGIAVKCTTLPPPTHGLWVNPEADYELLYPYNPERAVELLREIFEECTGADGRPAWCDPREGGRVVEIEILSLPLAVSPVLWWISQYAKSELESVNLRVTVTAVSTAELDARISAGTAQAWIIGWSFGRFPLFMRFFFHSDEIRPGGWNEWKVRDPELDEILDNFYFTKDIEEAVYYAHLAQEILVERWLPWIPTYTGVGISAWNSAIDRDTLVLNYAPPLRDPVGFSWFWWKNVRFRDTRFGGTFRFFFTVDITTLHPAYYLWASEADFIFRVYAGTMIVRPEDIYAEPRIPLLLESWKVEEVTLPDETTWYKFTLNLYDGILWHDGVPMTAEDWAYTISKFGLELRSRRYWSPILKNVVELRPINKTALEIVLTDYGWSDIYLFTEYTILPKHIFERLPDPTRDPSLLPHPFIPGLTAMIGQGPYVAIRREIAYAEAMWNPIYFWRHPEKTVQFERVDVPETVDPGTLFKITVKLVDWTGKAVTTGTLRVTLTGPTTIGPLTATHIGGGVYELTLPGLESGEYTAVIEASMPYMLPVWTLRNTFTTKIYVGVAPTRELPVLPEIPRLPPIEIPPPLGELKPAYIEMPPTVTVPVTPVEVTPAPTVTTPAIPSATNLTLPIMALGVITLIAGAATALARKKG
ncbi:MAG: ABC transporter substrate-binding protein [Desulfurococcaceae archaeon]